ncbi:unnamed protein product [Knipowitschia caucasica]|uniref:Fibronectin type-III domain-containing protein n=1 Tax=Knipowitschia caucasica TaxID=637954 RepID=A0AAV2MAC6_KNICA
MWSLMVLLCYVYVTSGKEKVLFTSRNFINVLEWTAAKQRSPGEKILYSVLYSDTDGEEFKKKAECQNITELFCDLTEETPPVYDVDYRAKVQVQGSDYIQTKRFKPVAKTVLGAPLVSLVVKKRTLHVDVKTPLGRNNASVSDIIKKIKIGASEIPTFYSLIITEPQRAVQEMETTTGHFEVDLKDSQAEHCGYVVYKPGVEWGRPVSEKADFCVTPPAGEAWWPWVTLSAVLLLLLVTAAVVCAKSYVTKMKKTWPQSLRGFSPQHVKDPNQLLMHPEEGHISKPEILTQQEREKMVYANTRTIAAAPSALESGYGHTHSFSSWPDEFNRHSPTLRYQNDSFGSSVVYGGVTVQDEGNGDLHQLQGDTKESQEWILPGFPQSGAIVSPQTLLPDVDSHDDVEGQTLLLPTQRDSNGLLTLSMLLQPMNGITETIVSPQTKQLLPYLKLSSDLGANFGSLQSLESSVSDENSLLTPDYDHSHYLSNQQNFASPDSSCEDSGIYDTPYKQNMMPQLCSLKYS